MFFFFLMAAAAAAAAAGGGRRVLVGSRPATQPPLKLHGIKTSIPARMPKETAAQHLARWQERWTPCYVKSHGCKPWYWGFNVFTIAGDAANYGGAKLVDQIMDWIIDYTGLQVITNLLNLKFKFMLKKYSVATEDKDGAWAVTSDQRKRISRWTGFDRKADVPPVPLPDQAGWTACWLNKTVGNVYEDDDEMETILRPVPGNVYAGSFTWEWSWLISTTRLRALLRHDKINLSALEAVQCEPSYWWPVLKKYVDDIYK